MPDSPAAEGFTLRPRSGAELGFDPAWLRRLVERTGPLAVVDLETTGLPRDPRAEILEIGVLTFDLAEGDIAGVTVAALSGLVRPSDALPPDIQRITGLCDRDVASAPRLEDVRYRVDEALKGRVIVAHNAEFERAFLSSFLSPDFKRAVFLDTQDLLALTHPDASDLRLATFVRELLGREEQHRALQDAIDTAAVLAEIAAGAERGEPRYTTARRALDRYEPASPWLEVLRGPLLVDEAPKVEDVAGQFIAIGDCDEAPVPFDEDAIVDVLCDEARGRRHFPGYRVRDEQIELARYFVRHLRDGKTMLLEGGTGVGKSLAYLAAAIPFARERRERGERGPVVISTRTKLLQDQLLRKDIGAAARFLGYPQLRALSIKGRANYVCERRLEQVLDEGRDLDVFPDERAAYGVLLACARTRPHAEIGGLPAALMRRYPRLRDLRTRSVAGRAEHCSREACAKTPGCPFGARRAALAKADLVVANHDLLLRWPSDYPRLSHVICDEAHELAGVADNVYAQVVQPDEVLERIDEIFGRPSDRGEARLLPIELRKRVAVDVVAWRREIDLAFAGLAKSVAGFANEFGELQLPAEPDVHLPDAARFAREAASHLDEVARCAELLAAERSKVDDNDDPLMRGIGDLYDAADGLRMAFSDMPSHVSSFESLGRPGSRFRLSIRPVNPASSYHAGFMDGLDSFAAVSASLFVADDAFAALGELEIEERGRDLVERVRVASPFPYRDNMRAVALSRCGDPVADTARVLELLARELGGRTLGLFTSLRRMHEVATLLSSALDRTGIEVLAPVRAHDDPAALVDRFANSRGGAVLLGARTFWQGLDLPGDGLQAVVIEKLPFEVPTELRRRREERVREAGEDPFSRLALGKMKLHLKQMTGRLIRSETDRGIAVIVDARADRPYFQTLSDAFPGGTQVRLVEVDALPGVLEEVGLGSRVAPQGQG